MSLSEYFDRVHEASKRIETVCAGRPDTDPVFQYADKHVAEWLKRAEGTKTPAECEELARGLTALAGKVEARASNG